MTGHERDLHSDAAVRAALAGLDPTRPGGPAFAEDPTPADLQERIMATTERPTTSPADRTAPGPRRYDPRHRWLAAAAAFVVVLGGVAGALAVRGGDEPRTPPAVALTVPGGDGAVSSSCVAFDVALLRDMPVAFAGTVTAVTDGEVTLGVDRWYRGSAAQQRAEVVTVAQPGGNSSVALDGVEFVQGQRYLVTATNGSVNGCGFSGPADAALTAAYEQAFGG